MINKDRLVKEFIKYVKIDSETGNEGEFTSFIVEELKALGAEVWTDNAGEKINSNGNNVYAWIDGNIDKESILFSSHMDTVKIGKDIQPVIKDDIIYSSGDTILGSDDKSGISAVIEALKVIKENNISHRPIEIVFTISEEGGLKGSKNLDFKRIKSKLAYVLDSSGDVGNIIVQGPGQYKLHVKVIGKKAHAGLAPESGISAIQVAAEAVSKMSLLRIDEETTANIGSFIGDSATNIVCPEVKIVAEARSLNEIKLEKQTNHMINCFEEAAKNNNTEIEYKSSLIYKPFKINDDEDIIKLAEKACEKLNIKSNKTSTGGGSDANNFNCNGIKAVNLATGMTKVHTNDEYIKIENLVKTSMLVLELMMAK